MSSHGRYVLYADHLARIAQLEAQAQKLATLVEHAMKLEICMKHDFEPGSADYAACEVNIERYREALAAQKKAGEA